MRVGVVKEVKQAERRVGLIPATAGELVGAGHEVLVETGAGSGSGFSDADYAAVGASIEESAATVWEASELLVKVKEPVESEYGLLHSELTLFTYLHLASAPELVEALVHSGCLAIAYETVTDSHGALPLLAPMSEVAGRLATQAGAYFLQAPQGGSGILIGGVPGVAPARVTVIGGGVVGSHAARVASGMGAEVCILERSLPRIRQLEELFGDRIRVLFSHQDTLEAQVTASDLVIGAVLVPGTRAPRLLTAELVRRMQPRSVFVDVAIDQGGCAETSRPTTHAEPVFEVADVIHYCVTNMPGAVPVTSTRALTSATAPYVVQLADRGVEAALADDPGFAAGVNVRAGTVVLPGLASEPAVAAA